MNTDQIRKFRKSLRVFARIVNDSFNKNETLCGLSVQKCHILLEIDELEETSIKNLESVMYIDKSTLSKSIDSLVKSGFVERATSKEDRRFITCSLTEEGKKTVEEINRFGDENNRQILSLMAESDQAIVLDSMNKLAEVFMQAATSNDKGAPNKS